MKGVYIFLANGFEETEALATLDVLRRGGVEAYTVSTYYDPCVTGSHGIKVLADFTFDSFKASDIFDASEANDVMIFPGGLPGSQYLADNEELMNMMQLHYAEGGTVAAICAAPGLVASQLPGLEGKKVTCYDGFEPNLQAKGAEYEKVPAVVDGRLITGRGPGCVFDFGLAILAYLKGEETAAKVKEGMLL